MNTNIKQDDIVRIEKMGNKTFMVFEEGEVSESLLSIDELDKSLASKGFIRIHPNHLVNHHHLKQRFDKLTKWVTLDNGDKIPIGSQYTANEKPGFMHFLQRLLPWYKH